MKTDNSNRWFTLTQFKNNIMNTEKLKLIEKCLNFISTSLHIIRDVW